MKRREFLKLATAYAGGASLFSAAKASSLPCASEAQKKLVIVYLRGGADGLNMIVPHGDNNYYKYRAPITIPRPGTKGGAIDLDGYFGIHPSLSRIKDYWDDRSLAIFQWAGFPTQIRSHYDAQERLESIISAISRVAEARTNHFQLESITSDGWDAHYDQSETNNLLSHLNDKLCELVEKSKPSYRDTTILVVSEFGRSVRDNASGGTDHGHGNTIWALGGSIPGGKVYGRYDSLASRNLHEQRVLPVTTDFRQILAYLLSEQMSVSKTEIRKVFPDFDSSGDPFVSG